MNQENYPLNAQNDGFTMLKDSTTQVCRPKSTCENGTGGVPLHEPKEMCTACDPGFGLVDHRCVKTCKNGKSAPWTEHFVLSELKRLGNMRIGNMNSLEEDECLNFRSALLKKIAPKTVHDTLFLGEGLEHETVARKVWNTKQLPRGCQFVQNLEISEKNEDFETGVNTVLGWDIVFNRATQDSNNLITFHEDVLEIESDYTPKKIMELAKKHCKNHEIQGLRVAKVQDANESQYKSCVAGIWEDEKGVLNLDHHTCGVTDKGSIECFGNDASGQTNGGKPKQATDGNKFVGVSAGYEHTCGVTDKGSIECFGNDASGQTNGGNPKQATDGNKFVGVSAGRAHTCGVTDKGLIECFGNDVSGQTNGGNPKQATDDNMDYLVRINMVERAAKFVGVSAGYEHTCGVTDKGLIECFGNDASGQTNGGKCRTCSYVWCDGQRVD